MQRVRNASIHFAEQTFLFIGWCLCMSVIIGIFVGLLWLTGLT